MVHPEGSRRIIAQHLLTKAAHATEELVGVKLPWGIAHFDDPLTPERLADHIAGYGEYRPIVVPSVDTKETVVYARNPGALAEKLGSSETPLVVVSGPSTSGQTAVVAEVMKRLGDHDIISQRVMTATDKSQDRPGEESYYVYLKPPEFDEYITTGELVEYEPSRWGPRYGTPVANLGAVLDARPHVAFLIVGNEGSRNVQHWMAKRYPDNPVIRAFILRKASPLSIAFNVMTKRTSFSDWIPRIEDALHDIYDAGVNPFDMVVSNLPEPSGVPVRTSEALATFFVSHLKQVGP